MSTKRLLAVWLLLAVVMTLNGIVRELLLVPQIGADAAGVLSAILGIAIVLGVTGLFFAPLVGAPTRQLARTSVVLVAITIVFELLIGRVVDGKTWSELAANYALWNGRLWPLVLATVAIAPFFWGRWVDPWRGTSRPLPGPGARRAA